jgi:hypothetical protein
VILGHLVPEAFQATLEFIKRYFSLHTFHSTEGLVGHDCDPDCLFWTQIMKWSGNLWSIIFPGIKPKLLKMVSDFEEDPHQTGLQTQAGPALSHPLLCIASYGL